MMIVVLTSFHPHCRSDIDYMDQYRDFTLDPADYPQSEMAKFYAKLHSSGHRGVLIVDPGIQAKPGYDGEWGI
jgi:alpha-glucosidase (family GH31 glycosyl hydrolase)